MMGILDRVRAAMLRRDRAALKAADYEDRAGATTDDLMHRVNDRAAQIVHIDAKLKVLEDVGDEPDTDFGDTRPPSEMFIPTEGEYKWPSTKRSTC